MIKMEKDNHNVSIKQGWEGIIRGLRDVGWQEELRERDVLLGFNSVKFYPMLCQKIDTSLLTYVPSLIVV